MWALAREPQSGGSRTLDAGGFLTGAKFLLVLETPKEATPEPWAEGQATEGVRSSSAAWVPGWPLASLRQELGPGDQPRGRALGHPGPWSLFTKTSLTQVIGDPGAVDQTPLSHGMCFQENQGLGHLKGLQDEA